MDEDPQGPAERRADVERRPDTSRRRRRAQRVRRERAPRRGRGPRPRTAPWRGRPATPSAVVYARSALKPLQAAAMVDAGLSLDDRLLAVVCASHDGRPEHVAAVREILAGAGLDPTTSTTRRRCRSTQTPSRRRSGPAAAPASILQNCSGKHAGMLATAIVNGWPTAGYTAPDHPVQRTILEDARRGRPGRSTTSVSTAAAHRRRRSRCSAWPAPCGSWPSTAMPCTGR